MSSTTGGRLEPRGAAVLVFVSFVAIGVIVVFAGTLARATELEATAAQASAAVEALKERLAAGNLEIEFLETDRFVQQQARANGYGSRGERPFQLPDDAPSPPAIVALGDTGAATPPLPPFDAWLELLFGG